MWDVGPAALSHRMGSRGSAGSTAVAGQQQLATRQLPICLKTESGETHTQGKMYSRSVPFCTEPSDTRSSLNLLGTHHKLFKPPRDPELERDALPDWTWLSHPDYLRFLHNAMWLKSSSCESPEPKPLHCLQGSACQLRS